MANRNTRRQKARRKKNNARKRRHAAAFREAFQDGLYVIVSKSRRPELKGAMLLDPKRAKLPDVTADPNEARRFHGRNGAHKFLVRHPKIARKFRYQRIDTAAITAAAAAIAAAA